jgi:hypothetical protein
MSLLAVVPPYATLFCGNMTNAPNFWWYFMHRFGYSAEIIFSPALVLLSRGLFFGVKLLKINGVGLLLFVGFSVTVTGWTAFNKLQFIDQ